MCDEALNNNKPGIKHACMLQKNYKKKLVQNTGLIKLMLL